MTGLRRAVTLGRLRHIEGRDWPAVVVTVAVAVVVEVGLRTIRLTTLARLVGAPLADANVETSGASRQLDLPAQAVRRLQLCARILRHWPFDEKCLRRSLVCGWRIRGLDPRLVVGVALVDGEVKAHAWLTVDGVSLDPSGPASFSVLRPVEGP
jgi:hypothetical protein